MPELGSEALDFRALRARPQARRSGLETLRLVTANQGRKVFTVSATLLFGEDRERHFPDAWIQAGRVGVTDKSRMVDHAERYFRAQ
jgi:ATP-dependent DNA helicase RecG